MYSFKDYAGESNELVALIRQRNARARSLLDVACGTGLHLSHLRAAFPDVAGVDVEPAMLAVARKRLEGVPLHRADMRDMALGRRFDAVTCLFSSVGYLPGAEDLDLAVARMAAHLSPGGVLVIDGWVRPDRWREPGLVQADAQTGAELAVARLSRSRRDGAHTVLDMRYLIGTSEGIESAEERHELTLFADEEYRRAFGRAGLSAEVVPSPMGPDRDRYVAVAP
jgi:SAM-dependent methyltransferase